MKITLDEIIPYKPPLPPKPSISFKIIPPLSKLPPLIHPLPQKPHSRHQSPSCPNQLLHESRSYPISSPIDQESRAEVPSYQNVFDSELAAWSDMAVEATAIVSVATENIGHQQPQCRGGSKGLEIDIRKQPPGIQSENWQHGSQNGEASPGISAGFLEHERSCSAYQGTTEPVTARREAIQNLLTHKLSLAHIKAGLQDMELDRIVRYQEDESPEDICRRVVAAVITQLFHYMYESGNEYGCVATGEAFIFLRVPCNNPSVVLYYLSVPQEDVGNSTGWTGDVYGDNRLHLTAVSQLLAFTLRALRTSPRDIAWRSRHMDQLETWEMVYDDLLEEIEEKDIPASDYKPSPSQTNYYRQSPVKTRSKSVMAISCEPTSESRLSDHEDDADDDHWDPPTPSRAPRDSRSSRCQATAATTQVTTRSQQSPSKGKSRKYCTQQCLRGLRGKGPLDPKCPNTSEHGTDRHRLNTAMLIKLLDRQLSQDTDPNKELGCESLHIHGTRGALFKITLWSHGYTFVGKGVPIDFIKCARQEEVIYFHLRAIQEQFVPVVLGGLDLRRPFSYDGIAMMAHLTLMSYAGRNLARQHEFNETQLIAQAETSLRAIHDLGILHSDPNPGNMIWNEEHRRVMFIDFERAQYQKRTPLGTITANQKRKRVASVWEKSPNKRLDFFHRELSRMRSALRF